MKLNRIGLFCLTLVLGGISLVGCSGGSSDTTPVDKPLTTNAPPPPPRPTKMEPQVSGGGGAAPAGEKAPP